MKTAKAGAGLPDFERLFVKYILIPISRTFLGWDSSLKLLKKEVELIENMIKDIPKEKLQERVKINRVFGIEEHSSNYSVNMTLEHLSIVTNAVIFVIDTLSKEQTIDKKIKIEAVKPSQNRSNENDKFFETMKKYSIFIEKHPKKISQTTKAHPWFVEFNNKEWATFTFIHTFVHRRQIEAIIKGLDY